MSTSETSHCKTQHSDKGTTAESAFWDAIFYAPTICSRCFSIIRQRDEYHPDVGVCGGVSKYAPTERVRVADRGVLGYGVESCEQIPSHITASSPIPRVDYQYGYRPLHHQRTYCGNCGSESGKPVESHTLSKYHAKEHAHTLADRLNERGIDVNHDKLSYCVGKLKGYRKLASHDTKIFAAATKIAIRRSR